MEEVMVVTSKTPIEIALQIDDEGKTTAKKLYEWLELNPSNYSRWVKANITENDFAEENVDYWKNSSRGKSLTGRGNTDDYKLSATFAKRLSMFSKTERGEQARNYFIGCEQALARLAEQIRKTELERAKGIAVRQALTKAIQQSSENDRMHGHAYSTYTNLIYKAIFGKNANQLKEDYGIQKSDNLRDCFSEEELKAVSDVEYIVSGFVGRGWGYGEIKAFIESQNFRRGLIE